MRRKKILGAVGATALTIGLGVGATQYANGDSSPPTSTGSITMMDATDTMDSTHINDGTAMSSMNATDMTTTDGTHMNDGAAMSSMMNGSRMTTMMGADGMAAMHTAMHDAVGDSLPAEVLEACDEVHTSMSNTPAPPSTDVASDHAAHHAGSQP